MTTNRPPYSPILSDVTDCANSDDDLNEFNYDEMVTTEANDVLFPTPSAEVENTQEATLN